MHVNLYGSALPDSQKPNLYKIVFDPLPPVYFINNQTVAVTELFIQWKGEVTHLSGELSSSLIDKSTVNQKQQLIFVYQKKKSDFTYISPTQIAEYKIQCHSLQSSEFTLQLTKAVKIEKIYIQLKINEGVQRVNKKKI